MAADPTAAERQRRRRERLKTEQQSGGDIESVADDFDDADEDAGEEPTALPASTNAADVGGKRFVELIYRPSADEPSQTVWNKIKFLANVPVTLDRQNPAHSYSISMPEYSQHPMTGQRMSNHVEKMMFMGDMAKGWIWEVDGVRTQRIIPAPKKKVPPAGMDWAGTDREEVIDSATIAYPDDIPEGADGIVISGRR